MEESTECDCSQYIPLFQKKPLNNIYIYLCVYTTLDNISHRTWYSLILNYLTISRLIYNNAKNLYL